ncbi:beta-1,6-N-acetylglucosaminyltransferase [Flavobacterium daejeonense]|uniref:beta-1,6-N-acetylglucosaminyltransferase n=1 Tax=Flavobacterium daejeonense TaxID=350893 RepID=UPI00047CE63D|nr:beta-1,6-N-acetylglucosaminyltransferase [Flavobacterium daejeonense]
MMDKINIAYLITAYHNYGHLEKLIRALQDTNVYFYIHIDKNSEMPTNLNQFTNIKFIKRHKVWWAGWSHQKAIFNLMAAAVKDNYDYYALLSGSDYPIRSNEFLYNKLQQGGEFISIKEGFPSDLKRGWITNFYFDLFYRRKPNKPIWIKILLRLEKKISLYFPKKNFPFKKVFFGPTWWILTHSTVRYILDFLNSNRHYERFFKNSFCCEEILIPTIIGNSGITNIKGNLTYVDWSVHPGPAFVSKKHLAIFENDFVQNEYGDNVAFFARKFDKESEALLDFIDLNFRA